MLFSPQTVLQRLSDLTGPYWGTYRIVYRVLQPLLGVGTLFGVLTVGEKQLCLDRCFVIHVLFTVVSSIFQALHMHGSRGIYRVFLEHRRQNVLIHLGNDLLEIDTHLQLPWI